MPVLPLVAWLGLPLLLAVKLQSQGPSRWSWMALAIAVVLAGWASWLRLAPPANVAMGRPVGDTYYVVSGHYEFLIGMALTYAALAGLLWLIARDAGWLGRRMPAPLTLLLHLGAGLILPPSLVGWVPPRRYVDFPDAMQQLMVRSMIGSLLVWMAIAGTLATALAVGALRTLRRVRARP